MPFYKVIRGVLEPKTPKVISSETIWEGTSLQELQNKFPRRLFANGNNDDALRPIWAVDSRTVTVFASRESESDDWKPIPDPRPQIVIEPFSPSAEKRRKAEWQNRRRRGALSSDTLGTHFDQEDNN